MPGLLTRIPSSRDMARRGRSARRVLIVLNAGTFPKPIIDTARLITDTCRVSKSGLFAETLPKRVQRWRIQSEAFSTTCFSVTLHTGVIITYRLLCKLIRIRISAINDPQRRMSSLDALFQAFRTSVLTFKTLALQDGVSLSAIKLVMVRGFDSLSSGSVSETLTTVFS